MPEIYDARICTLGEGPLWHPERRQLFWFDILGKRLLLREGARPLEWPLDEHASAAGWIDRDSLLVASETGLWRFPLSGGARTLVQPLEAERSETRSNDGRADPMGGFWIGTMGKKAERGAGAIYRWYRGTLRRLFTGITIPNAICFAADGRTAFFADSAERRVLRQPLDAQGWPKGEAGLFLDLAPDNVTPDGAVIDAEDALWIAQWGAGRVARYRPDGRFDRAIKIGGRQSSCPAFGGPNLGTLFITTAREDLSAPNAGDGALWSADAGVSGRPEPRIVL